MDSGLELDLDLDVDVEVEFELLRFATAVEWVGEEGEGEG